MGVPDVLPLLSSLSAPTMLLGVGTVTLALCAARLATPLAFPTCERVSQAAVDPPAADAVVLAGSFNPTHLGHLSMLRHLAARHKKVYAVIGYNPDKAYPVSAAARRDILEMSLAAERIDGVHVALVEGYIWRFAMAKGCKGFYRGIRSWEQDGKEERQLHFLNQIGPILYGPRWPVPTTFLIADPSFAHISSSLVRQRAAEGKDIRSLVPPEAAAAIHAAYGSSPTER